MNVNTDTRADAFAAAARRSATSERAGQGAQEQSFPPADAPAASSGAADTVEISEAAREALQVKKPAIAYTKKDLAPLKDRFSKLLKKEADIFGRIAGILSGPGFKRAPFDQLKIEIDSKGRAIVGGLGDVKTARALEKAINSDKQLLQDIAGWQAEEKNLSADLHAVTGMSLGDYEEKIDFLQRIDPPLDKDSINLKGQELYAVDSEFADMIGGRAALGGAFMDISGRNNILEDAEGTVNKMMGKVTGGIADAFKDMNDAIRQNAAEEDNPAQYIEDSVVDLARLKISVDASGQVTVEGTASRNNPKTDREAKKIIAKMFEEELKANPATGEQHDFKIAASYLLNSYDENFGKGNPLGLGADDRTLETVYDHGKISSRVSSPEREAELAEEMDKTAKDALKDMGIDAGDLVIEMNDEGKLVAANLNPDAPEAKGILRGLDFLNKVLAPRSSKDAKGDVFTFAAEPLKRLKGLMANMDVLRPGGASLLKRE